jgi:hypothetical protein
LICIRHRYVNPFASKRELLGKRKQEKIINFSAEKERKIAIEIKTK